MTATSPVLKQIAGLPKLSHAELKALWREYFGVEPPAYRRGFLARGLAHRLQELTYGGLKPAYQARLDAMIEGAEKPNGNGRPGRGPRQDVHLLEGTKLLREWRGVTHEVTVIDGGYEHQGKRYRSLSAVARAITGTQSFCTTTSMGRLTLNILLSFAQFERELAGERIRDKFAASRAKGMWMGGSPPLGYNVRDRKLAVNPAEAELVRLIFRRFLDLGSALLLIRELNAQGHRTKSWTTQVGTFREGRPFDKGTLYKILRNRTYIGEAVHKGQSHQGEHEPIVDRATWERVHEVLAANAKRRGNEARARTPAPLRGLMRCTHCSSAMTPTHTHRRGRLYRYYVCLGASRRGHDTCPVRSIAASEVESLVLTQVRRLLASPELVARTITTVRRENGAAEDLLVDENEVIEALGDLDPVWDELYPTEQARILRLLIERVEVAPDGISLTLHAAGIRSLVAELADQEAPALATSEPLLKAAE